MKEATKISRGHQYFAFKCVVKEALQMIYRVYKVYIVSA